ncbi:MAG: hypothetical protein V5A62_11955 [Haloarculaceae archaeon]
MIVVATADFEVYHDVVGELRDRGVTFTTVEPGDDLSERTRVVVTGPDDEVDPGEATLVRVSPDEPRRAVEEALATLRGGGGRTVIGVDPGERPGIAVLSGETVVAAFAVPLADAVETVERELEGAVEPVVRVGDGARLQGARIVDALEDVRVELVDETGTTPYLGQGTRGTGVGDVLAAVNIARLEGEPIASRDVEPTPGEIQVVKNRSRERSPENRELTDRLARRVALGELSLEEAMTEHRGE